MIRMLAPGVRPRLFWTSPLTRAELLPRPPQRIPLYVVTPLLM